MFIFVQEVIDSNVISTPAEMIDTTKAVVDSVSVDVTGTSLEVISEMQRLGGSVVDVVHNTAPLNFGMGDLGWWNFGIGIAALIAGTLAAIFGFLGFRYQKRAAVSLEGREGKAFQLDMIIRMIWSSMSSLLAFHHSSKAGHPVHKNKIESLKIPQELIDPSMFSTNAHIYSYIVQFKRDITKLNLDIDTFSSYYGSCGPNEQTYVKIIQSQMLQLVDHLGMAMGLIDYSALYKRYVHDQRKEYKKSFLVNLRYSVLTMDKEDWILNKKESVSLMRYLLDYVLLYFLNAIYVCIVCPLSFCELLVDYLKKCFSKKSLKMRPGYYCSFIGQALLNEHFNTFRTLDNKRTKDILSFTQDESSVLKLFLKDGKWDEKVFSGSVKYECKDLMLGYLFREFAEQPGIREKYPHVKAYREGQSITLSEFVQSALSLETALKATDDSFLV